MKHRMKHSRRGFLRIALGGGALVFIPKVLLKAAPDAEGVTEIHIENAKAGDHILIYQAKPYKKVIDLEVLGLDEDNKHISVDVPLKWGAVRVILETKKQSHVVHLPGETGSIPLSTEYTKAEEIDHDRRPEGTLKKQIHGFRFTFDQAVPGGDFSVAAHLPPPE